MSAHVANGPASIPPEGRRGAPLAAIGVLIASVVGLALLLALSGAFDTDEIAPGRRAILWLIISGLLVGQASGLDAVLSRAMPPRAVYRALAAGMTVVVTILLMALELRALKLTSLPPPNWGYDPLPELVLFIAPTIAVVTGLVLLLRGAFVRGAVIGAAAGAPAGRQDFAAPEPAAPTTLDWPEEPVLWVRAHDHYLEVATAGRTRFVRGRMGAAVARLRTAPGLQVHRSWWVAKDAVAAVRREGRDIVLVLGGGGRAPVGRSRIGALRASGWL